MVSRDVLCSIKPKYVELILNGSKTLELRRKFNRDLVNSSIFIYATHPVMAVVASATITKIETLEIFEIWRQYEGQSGVNEAHFFDYFKGCELGW